MSIDHNVQDIFVSDDHILPDSDSEKKNVYLKGFLDILGASINKRVEGTYGSIETMTGKKLIIDQNGEGIKENEIFRKVIDCGALPVSGPKTVPHGIVTTENFKLIHLYGSATSSGASALDRAIPIPYIDGNLSVKVDMDATNINLDTATGPYTGFATCFVVVEYIKIL